MHRMRLTVEKLTRQLSELWPLCQRERHPIAPFHYHVGPERLVDPVLDHSDWPVLRPGEPWGGLRQEFTMRTSFSVPAQPGDDLLLHLPIGTKFSPGDFLHPEALAYIDGEAWMAVDRNHQELPIPARCRDGRPHVLALHGWCGIVDELVRMGEPAVVVVDRPARELLMAMHAVLETAINLDESNPTRHRLLNAIDAAYRALDLRPPLGPAFYDSVGRARQVLEAGLQEAGPPLDVEIIATGHAHIDVAWLWELRHTREKAARSWSNVLRLMEEFPEFRFTQSQPQLYAYLQQDQPELFAQIQRRVSEGRWEITGGMWVEADCNISGAEALARQFVLGRRYFRQNFDAEDTPILWLPDVFGYPWSLPQLAKQAGMAYFMTTKTSWSIYNRMPYDTYWWQGLDGTRILTHIITTPSKWRPETEQELYTYNGILSPEYMLGTWDRYRQKEQNNLLLTAFGWGDGGGGPTREMLELACRMREHPGLPRVRQGSAHEFFQALSERVGADLPVWNGELYLEYHRGTYTSQAQVKRANRKSEAALHCAEFFAAWAAEVGGFNYPHAELTRAWELLCLNQFHDILPGSSIGPVYAESLQQYAEVAAIAEQVQQSALKRLSGALRGPGEILLFNPTSFSRDEIIFVPGSAERPAPQQAQPVADGFLVRSGPVPGYGYRALDPERAPSAGAQAASAGPAGDGWRLENNCLLVELDAAGDITRLYDKELGREVLAPGEKGNVLQAFEDRPVTYDAWDIEIYYQDKMFHAAPASSIRVAERGPLRATLEIERRILNSSFVQRISLQAGSRRLDVDMDIDWQERQTLLKVAFPVDVLAHRATYDIQWGNIERPTHWNTSWDWARFEVPAHKWADLSEGDFGVSLLNDCKYGYDVKENVLRLTLLRGPTYPDPQADLGEHRFRYSLLPHPGDWRSGTAAAAYALNYPLIVTQGQRAAGAQEPAPSLLALDAPNVIVETVKQAEDGQGIIVRLYENERSRTWATLRSSLPLRRVERCNILEEPQEELELSDGAARFFVKPYEIVTLRLVTA